MTRGDPEEVLGITPTDLYGAAPVPRPPLLAPAVRDRVHTFLQTQEVTAVTGVHLVWLPPAPPDDPRGPRALSPAPDWELTTRRATGPSTRNAQTAWNGVPASEGKGHPDRTARDTQRRNTRGGKGGTGDTQHQVPAQTPRAGRERRTHTDGALHPPRQ